MVVSLALPAFVCIWYNLPPIPFTNLQLRSSKQVLHTTNSYYQLIPGGHHHSAAASADKMHELRSL